MKKYLSVLLMILFATQLFGQNNTSRKHSTYYHQRNSLFEYLSVDNDDIIFLGNSMTDGAEWSELFNNPNVKNRGISGDKTMGVYDRLDNITIGKPKKIFLMIGINDLGDRIDPDTVVNRIQIIIKKIQRQSPETKIYLQSILPVNDEFKKFSSLPRIQYLVKNVNKELKDLSDKCNVTYIDLFSHFEQNNDERLSTEFTNDGLHLTGAGYIKWVELIQQYIKE